MADQSAAGFSSLEHSPGNPLFPTLPGAGDPDVFKIGWPGQFASLQRIGDYPETPPVFRQSAAPSLIDGFGGWYLNQIIVTPNPIDFGDIADEKDVDVTFYSTYKTNQVLDDITIPVDALDITGVSPLLPLDLTAFSDTIVTFRADQAGPQQFDDDITITLGNGFDFDVRTLGRRVLMVFGEPENGFVETVNFATDIMRSKDGTEQAFSLRRAPFSEIRYTFRMPAELDSRRTTIETILFGGAPVLPLGFQLWYEAERITSEAQSTDTVVNIDTTNMQIAVGQTFSFTTPNRVNAFGTIASFTASSITFEQPVGILLPLQTFGAPIRFGHMTSDVDLRTAPFGLQDINMRVRTESDIDISNLDTTYFDQHPSESPGRPILKQRCMQGDQMPGSISRVERRLDSITGRLFVTGTEPVGEWASQAFVYCRSKAEIRAWREFLHYVRGDWGTFYMPTFQNDLPLNTDLAEGTNSFIIPFMGISTYLTDSGVPYAPKRDLRIVLDDGSVWYRRIVSVVDNTNGTETVTLDGVVGSAGFSSPAETTISWMHLCRMDGDTARFRHRYLGEADLTFRIRSVKE